jgi:hypothetical protein
MHRQDKRRMWQSILTSGNTAYVIFAIPNQQAQRKSWQPGSRS